MGGTNFGEFEKFKKTLRQNLQNRTKLLIWRRYFCKIRVYRVWLFFIIFLTKKLPFCYYFCFFIIFCIFCYFFNLFCKIRVYRVWLFLSFFKKLGFTVFGFFLSFFINLGFQCLVFFPPFFYFFNLFC